MADEETGKLEAVRGELQRAQVLSQNGDHEGAAGAVRTFVELLLPYTTDPSFRMGKFRWMPGAEDGSAVRFAESTLNLIGFLNEGLTSAVEGNGSQEVQLAFLDGIVRVGSVDGALIPDDGWDDGFQLQRARVLIRLGRGAEADEIFQRVAGKTAPGDDYSLLRYAFGAGANRVMYLNEQNNGIDAGKAARELRARWIHHADLPLSIRRLFEQTLTLGYNAESAELPEHPDQMASVQSDIRELVEWASLQPEREFQERNAERLWEMIRLCVQPGEALDPLEHLVALLVELEDATLTKVACERVASRIAWLVQLPDEDQGIYNDALVDAMDEQEPLPEPDELGIADQSVSQLERVGDAFEGLVELLTATEADPEAVELRAKLLFAQIQVATRLGRDEKSTWLFEQMVAIGEQAISACDSLILEAERREATGGVATLTVVGLLMLKAGLFAADGDSNNALALFDQVIKRIGHSPRPADQAIVQTARDMQRELRNADE